MKELPRKWAEYLANQPETGMDYHIVAVTLRNGRRIEDVAVIHSYRIGEVRGHSDVPFEPEDVIDIVVTHRMWKFTR